MIAPESIAFDIDGVFADIMSLFIDIARLEYNLFVSYQDVTCYYLEDCLNIDNKIIDAILFKILSGDYDSKLKAIDGSTDVLNRVKAENSALLFVTARPCFETISKWIQTRLFFDSMVSDSMAPDSIEVVATGTFEAKTEVLINKNITHFVEDRLETCFALYDAGITPVLFKQPWNRRNHPFIEVGSWKELESLIEFTQSIT